MNTLTERDTSTLLAGLPRVNLLPPEIEEQRRFKRVQLALGAGVVGAVAVVGLLTFAAASQVSDAQSDLDATKARQTALQGEMAQYAEVPLVNAQVEAAEAQLTQAMGQEVRWSYFLNDLSLGVPGKVWLTSMTVTQNVDASTAAPVTADAGYLVPGIGKVQFEGQGYRHTDVAAFLDAVAKEQGLTQPYFTNSVKQQIGDTDAVEFSSQATVTEDALSGRWTQKAGS